MIWLTVILVWMLIGAIYMIIDPYGENTPAKAWEMILVMPLVAVLITLSVIVNAYAEWTNR